MKRKQSTEEDGSEWWSETELEIAQLILVLRRGCLLSRIPFTWGLKRKRSAIQDDAPSPSFTQTHNGGAGGGSVVPPSSDAGSPTVVKAQASSPATPLSFPATESDEKPVGTWKPKSSRRKTSLKRKREYYLQIIEDLTKTKDSLNQEIENVKRHCDQLKAFNLKLKAREQQLSNNGTKSDCKIPNLEIGQEMQLDQSNGSVNSTNSTAANEEQKKQKQQMQTQIPSHQNQNFGTSQIRKKAGESVVQFQYAYGHPTTSLLMASSSTSALGRNVDSNKGPLPLPDLNLSIEELSHVDSCQPLDETATNKDLSRAIAAQARQRRLQIFRLKKPIGV